jgi:putative membrane protein
MFWGGPGWGLWGLGWGVLWIGLIIVAVLLLRREAPHYHDRLNEPPALRLLEERYARGEISREEFLERMEVLLRPPPPPQAAPPPPAEAPPPPEASPTEPIPPSSSSG